LDRVIPRLAACIAVAGALRAAGGSPPAFSNHTAAAGVTVSHSSSGFANSNYAGGGAVGDFNRDGWQDIFMCKGGSGGLADRLFINDGDGTFTDRAADWGLTAAHKGKGAAVGDFNNDGWLDLYVTSAGPDGQAAAPGHNKLYRNNGNGTFTNVAASAGVAFVNPAAQDSWAACWGDYDLDGDLDLFVGGFLTTSPSNVGNRLFRNNGNETFTDVTAAIGLFAGLGPVASLSATIVDMNGDRWPELLLVGDFKGAGFIGSRYFVNLANGSFLDLTAGSHTGQEENGMGHTLGDFENDGKLDWYATSIYGNPPAGWTGNKLYRNLGNHGYFEYAALAGVNDGGYGWGALAVDFNHDGLLDVAETNGDGSTSGQFFNEQTYVWMNNGNATFTETAIASGLSDLGKGRAMLRIDHDNDGDQDVLIIQNNQPMNLYRNELNLAAADTHWLRVFLDTSGTAMAPDGFGAKVYTTAGGVTRMRSIDGGTSFVGTSELSAHFGLGSAAIVDELRVDWADGSSTILEDVAVNQTLTVPAAPAPPCAGDLDDDGSVGVVDFLALLGAWGPCPDPCPPACAADLDADCQVGVIDFLALLGAWGACRGLSP
jgi:hypothetical protein